MIEFIKKQKESVALICDAVDRLQRSFKEVPILEELRLKGKITIHFLRENQILDRKANSAQIMAYQMFVMMASSYANSISDNVKRGFGEKRRNGEVLGKVPIGYLNKEKDVVLDEVRSILVKRLFEDYSTGLHSCKDLAIRYGALGLTNLKSGKVLSNSQVDRMITHPFYYGMIEDIDEDGNKILREHKYPKLISKALFDKAQTIKHGRGHNRYKRTYEDYTFTGLIKCFKCGCSYSPYTKKAKYVYLRPVEHKKSGCDHITSIAEAHLIPQIEKVVKSIVIPEAIVEAIKIELQKDLEVEQKEQVMILSKLKQEHSQIKTKIQNWNLRCAEDNSITSIERNEVLKPLKEKQAELETQIAISSLSNDDFKITTFSLLELASKGYEIFKSSHTPQKRELINLICANLFLNAEKLDVSYAKPFDIFAKYREFTEWSG